MQAYHVEVVDALKFKKRYNSQVLLTKAMI